MWHSGWTGGDWILVAVTMVVFWALVVTVALAVWLKMRRSDNAAMSPGVRGPGSPAGADARAILDERLARGDLSPAEYQARRELLSPS